MKQKDKYMFMALPTLFCVFLFIGVYMIPDFGIFVANIGWSLGFEPFTFLILIAGFCFSISLISGLLFKLNKKVPFEEKITKRKKVGDEWGYVYILSNPAMPNMLKIGYTAIHPSKRIKQLDTTGVPEKFSLEFALRSDFARRIEAQAHRLLDDKKVRKNREFVKMSVSEAKDVINRAHNEVKLAMKK